MPRPKFGGGARIVLRKWNWVGLRPGYEPGCARVRYESARASGVWRRFGLQRGEEKSWSRSVDGILMGGDGPDASVQQT